jgi:transcriptional regulator with XRE-family HTH domain
MCKYERFTTAYEYLEWRDIIKTQQDVADAMGSTQTNVSLALSGKRLKDNFLRRFASAYADVISPEWLMYEKGDMLVDHSSPISDAEQKAEKSLIELCAQVIADNERLHQELREAIEETKKLHADLSQVLAELNSRTTINQTYNLAPADLPRVAET